MNEPLTFPIDFLSQSSHLHVDHVVDRSRPARLLPDVVCQHLAGNKMALMPKQVLQEIEFAGRQIEYAVASCGVACHEVQLQVRSFQPKDVGRPAAAQERANTGEQRGDCKRLDQVVVRAEIQSEYAVVHSITGGQDENRRLDVSPSESLQDFEAAPPGKHQIEHDEVE